MSHNYLNIQPDDVLIPISGLGSPGNTLTPPTLSPSSRSCISSREEEETSRQSGPVLSTDSHRSLDIHSVKYTQVLQNETSDASQSYQH